MKKIQLVAPPLPKKERIKITISDNPELLVQKIFKDKIPDEFLKRLSKETIDDDHIHGAVSTFFRGLTKGKLIGTFCFHCFSENPKTETWLLPRTSCPACSNNRMAWLELSPKDAEVITFSVVEYSDANLKKLILLPLIIIKMPSADTHFLSYVSEFGEGEPYIGMPIKPVFRTENPTYTILDLAWVPDDERIEMQKRKQREKGEEKERRKQLECFRCI